MIESRLTPRTRQVTGEPWVSSIVPFWNGVEEARDALLATPGNRVKTGAGGPDSLAPSGGGLDYVVYPGDVLVERAPLLVDLYLNALTAILRTETGDPSLVPLHDRARGVNVNVLQPGVRHEWHVDGPEVAYTSVTPLAEIHNGAGSHGAFKWHDGRSVQSVIPALRHTLFAPGHLPHAVSAPVRERVVMICAWQYRDDEADGSSLPGYLYGETS